MESVLELEGEGDMIVVEAMLRDPASSGQSERWNVKDQRKNVVLANYTHIHVHVCSIALPLFSENPDVTLLLQNYTIMLSQ